MLSAARSSWIISGAVKKRPSRNSQGALAAALAQVRYLNVHEYVSMDLFQSHGITTPECYVAESADEAERIVATKLNQPNAPMKDVVIKAQVLSGGRGLGTFKNGFKGGVHMISKPGQAKEYASKMLGEYLVTKQAPSGILCNKVLLMERVHIQSEMYLSIFMDRASQGPLMVCSPRGGTSIEEVAKNHPEVIFTLPIDIMTGLTDEGCHTMATNLGLKPGSEAHVKAMTLMHNLYDMFIACDCTQIEINPLSETVATDNKGGDIVVCDAKVNFDDNAEFRQASIFAQRDSTQEDPREVDAKKRDLNYIGLDGNIGCMVNGAGLAMATMDIIQLKGGSPANFLDVGGGADEKGISHAFAILDKDPLVKVILVNIFGGIMRCDVIANGIINASKEIGMSKPIVIRLQGTNADAAKVLIESSGHRMILADDLEDAATKAVGVADIALQAEKIRVGVQFDGIST